VAAVERCCEEGGWGAKERTPIKSLGIMARKMSEGVTMTAADLMEIIRSPDFRTGLEEISSYLASIMQEGPIKHLLAKCLWTQKHLYALERNKLHDLTVWVSDPSVVENETTIEFKFNYDTCCSEKLAKELLRLANRSNDELEEVLGKFSKWDVVRGIWKDVIKKEPNIFVWIICARDLSALSDADRKRIVNSEPLKKYTYKCDREYLAPAEQFLEFLKKFRPFRESWVEIETQGSFPSTYHFAICDFLEA
jgi:hypothetical protein